VAGNVPEAIMRTAGRDQKTTEMDRSAGKIRLFISGACRTLIIIYYIGIIKSALLKGNGIFPEG
jgi:hypothetical protein